MKSRDVARKSGLIRKIVLPLTMSAAALGLFGSASNHSEPTEKPADPAAATVTTTVVKTPVVVKTPTGTASLQSGIRW